MTRIRVGKDTFSLEESVNGAKLGDLYALKMQTRKDGSPGVSVKTISDAFTRVGELAAAEGFNPLDLLDDDVFIQNLIGVAYLARRGAGEEITFEQASQISFNDIEMIADEDDEVEADAPKEDAAAAGLPM